jgi:EmrB/QacA subfamily drug resistance transporter
VTQHVPPASLTPHQAIPAAPANRWLGLTVALTGAFMAIMDAFIVTISLPHIRADLHASFGEAQLVAAAYGLTYAVGLITGGRLGDLYGRKRMFMVGLGGFTLTSLACGLAPTPGTLIAARIAQGLSAAAMFPQVLSWMRVTFTDPAERARAFAALGLTQGLGSIAGQVVGGLIVSADVWGWRPIFLINVPVGLIALVLAARVLDESKAQAQKLDLAGAALSALALAFLIFPLIQGRELGWPAWTLAMLVLSLPALLLFIDHQRLKSLNDDSPLMDTRLFGHRAFVFGVAALFLLCTMLFSFFVILAFVLQAGLGLSPLSAALVFLPLAVTYVIAAQVAGRFPVHARMMLIAGGIGLTLGYAAIAGAYHWLALYPAAFIPGLIWLGVAQGLLFTPLLNTILSNIPAQHAGIASGVASTMQQAGGAFGVAVVGLIFFTAVQALQASGVPQATAYTTAFALALIYNLVAAGVMTGLLVALPRPAKDKAPQSATRTA